MLAQAAAFLVSTATGLLALAFLLRFTLQAVRAPARNPLSHFLLAVTDFAVRPARRVIPGLFGFDLATLVLAWLAETLGVMALIALQEFDFTPAAVGVIALLGAVRVVRLFVYVVMGAVALHALLSWINPGSPAAPLLNSVARPFLRPIRRLVPPVGNVDLSPLVLLVACQLLLTVPLTGLEGALTRLL